jgi:hypothetical protein
MSRNPRLRSVAFGWYYFAWKAERGRKIFTNMAELALFRELLIATLARHGVRICFLDMRPRATYLAVHAGENSIGMVTGRFCQTWTREINRMRNERGPLFQPHPVRRLVQQGESLLGLGRCIHCAAELENKVEFEELGRSSDEATYHFDDRHLHWSTKAVYLNGGRMSGVDASVARRIAAHGSRDPVTQLRASVSAFARPPTATEVELFRKGCPEDPRFIGSADFVAARCRELGVKPRPRANHYPDADAEMRRTVIRLVDAFRRLGDQQCPTALAGKWMTWRRMVTLEIVCSKSRAQPAPMLRGLAASHMRNRGIPQRMVDRFLSAKPRTLAAGRRQHYQVKFNRLFGRCYEDLFRAPFETGRVLMMMEVGGGDLVLRHLAHHVVLVPICIALVYYVAAVAYAATMMLKAANRESAACANSYAAAVDGIIHIETLRLLTAKSIVQGRFSRVLERIEF